VIDWGWLADHAPAIAGRAIQHLELAGLALVVGFAISFGLALVAVRRRRLYPIVTAIAGLLFTIPSLALFSAFVPITGLSLLTVEIPLVLYTLVIFVRNIVAGFDSVPADVREAADGMGYSANGRLLRVEVPLALPLIVAGFRLATVSTIGLVTITGILGQAWGGLGFFIFERLTFPSEVLAGAIGSIILAIGADVLIGRIQRRLTPWADPAATDERRLALTLTTNTDGS
jgi:osmoprotectant transport system permease protein